jgi:hypothetical protein
MGLYLCVFRGDDELEGVEVGSYDDFERFREAARALDRRMFRRFGTLRANIKPNTAWSRREAARLGRELARLGAELKKLPPRPFPPESWQEQIAAERRLAPTSLYDCFFDVDGEPLVERLLGLCRVSVEAREPILFQ